MQMLKVDNADYCISFVYRSPNVFVTKTQPPAKNNNNLIEKSNKFFEMEN